MNQDYQDKIDQYLLGQLSDLDRQAFEKELNINLELKKQFEFTKNVKNAIVGRTRRLAQIHEWELAYEAKKKRRILNRRYIYWISGIAASFIVGFFVFSPVFYQAEENPNSPVHVNYNRQRTTKDYTDIVNNINDGNYNLALTKIEEENKKLKVEKIQTEQEKSNIDNEEYSYLEVVYDIQADELNLLKAYAFIGLNRLAEAMTILDELRQKESKFKVQADSLYNLYK